MSRAIIFLLACFALNLNAQVKTVIVESVSKYPVPGALVEWSNKKKAAVSDQQGRVEIASSKIGYTVQSIGFETRSFDVLPDTVFLNQAIYSLPSISISNKPDSVYGHAKFHVADFVFWHNELTMLLYDHEKYFKKSTEGRELWEGAWIAQLNDKGKIVFSFYISEPAERLHLSPTGECFLLTENHVFQLVQEPTKTLELVSPEFFREQILPVCGSIHDKLIFQTFTKDYPEFAYYYYEKGDEDAMLIEQVADSMTLELFKAQYKYLPGYKKKEALQIQLDTGIPKEIVGGYMTGFQHDLYYHDPKAILIQQSGEWNIYNFSQNRIITIDTLGHIEKNDFQKDLIDLEEKFEVVSIQKASDDLIVFVVKGKGGTVFLYEKNQNSGVIEKKKTLHWNYTKNVTIQGNKVYYLYRPFESRETWYIYSENL
jgi:hypothetical protein